MNKRQSFKATQEEYVINGSDYYTVLLGGQFNPVKKILTVMYQSDIPTTAKIKKYVQTQFPELKSLKIINIKSHEGWFTEPTGRLVGYFDVIFE